MASPGGSRRDGLFFLTLVFWLNAGAGKRPGKTAVKKFVSKICVKNLLTALIEHGIIYTPKWKNGHQGYRFNSPRAFGFF
jgi:hypothetical protein